jgi:hypothetical protein
VIVECIMWHSKLCSDRKVENGRRNAKKILNNVKY